MPRGEGEEVDVYLFKLGRKVNDAELQEEYELRGLVPDPYALAAVNGADPAFADEHPNGTHWKDANGNWCYIAFGLWFHGYFVDVRHRVLSWNDSWFFGGVRNLNASKL
ncbi:MAG: hypothetical protein Q7R58_02700 [bacterium]|nr:hypothetical protein [bacterium]